jgi:uncharacterized membrane protein YraQ (UPF0718 family)
MSYIGHQLFHALSMAFAMFWEIFWALALGFFISGIVQAVVSKKEMSRLLPNDRAPSAALCLGNVFWCASFAASWRSSDARTLARYAWLSRLATCA